MNYCIPAILIVDDEEPVREFLKDALADSAEHVCTAGGFREALHAMELHPHDVVLCDICMPDSNGMDFLNVAAQLKWDCAVILMTGHATLDQVVGGVRLHAADFLLKPFTLDSLRRSTTKAYERLLLERQKRSEREVLASGLIERTHELEVARQTLRETCRSALESLVATLEAKEYETYAHSFRVRAYAMHLARLMNYPPPGLSNLAYAAVLHDIGKIGISDTVLLKPGPLTKEEFEMLKRHSALGQQIVGRMGFLNDVLKAIRHHHERWDGRGYPDGIRGEQIPIEARLFGVADTLDAMTSDRCYRKALTISDARAEILRESGRQFDPAVAEAALGVSDATWIELRKQADDDARSAIIRDDPGVPALPELARGSQLAHLP